MRKLVMLECQICKRVLGRLNGKHLKSHGLSAEEYRERFPGFLTCEPPPISDETREKMRVSRLGQKHSEETKAKIGSKHEGKTRSDEELKKWRESYQKYLDENGSPMLGKDRGEAFKEKMRSIAKSRPKEMVDAKVKMMLDARRGSHITDEQRVKYSEARVKYIEENPDKLPKKFFNTKPENEMAKVLEENGLIYKRNFNVCNRLFDFKISENILLEIDGPYHWNFKMYGNKNMPDEERMSLFLEAKKVDDLKTKIAADNGFYLYRIKVESALPQDWKEQLQQQGCDLF